MSITAATCNSFKKEKFDGVHQPGDVYKIALIKPASAGTIGKATANYSELSTDEVANGNGYTTGGATLSGRTSALTGDVANVTWTDPTWATASIAAAGALVYNSTQGGKALCVLDFGGTITSTAATFTVDLPASGAAALLREG